MNNKAHMIHFRVDDIMNKNINMLSEHTETSKSDYIRTVLKNYINRSDIVKDILRSKDYEIQRNKKKD